MKEPQTAVNNAFVLNKYITVFGIFIFSMLLSYFHSWGYINTYYCSYLKLFDPSITMLHVNFILTTMYFSEMFFWYAADYVKQKQNYSGAQCLGMFFLFLKFCCMSLTPNYFVWLMTNIIAAFCTCCYDINSTRLLLEWFPGQIGVAGGLNSTGFSFGSFWAFLAYWIINPQNQSPTIDLQEGYRLTKIFDESVAMNVPSFLHTCCIICLVYSVVVLFVIKNDPNKYREDPILRGSQDQDQSIELSLMYDTRTISTIRKKSVEEFSLTSINQSLINELDSIDGEINTIKTSGKFFIYIIIMSYMLGLPLYFNISKKSVGINAQDDLSLTFLSLPTTFLILFGRLFGAVIMENVGMNRFIVFWLSVSSIAIVVYYFFYTIPFVFFTVNCLLMQHQGMCYSCKMVFLITMYGETCGKKLITRAMTVMSVFRAIWPIFFDYLMTSIGMEALYGLFLVINIIIIYLILRVL